MQNKAIQDTREVTQEELSKYDRMAQSELMKDPKTGKILKLSELYMGNEVEVTPEELAKYDRVAHSGLMKTVDGRYISIPQMMLDGGNAGTVKSYTRPTKYKADKTIWVKERLNYSINENSFREITIDDLNVIPMSGASNFKIDSWTEEQDPVQELMEMWNYLDIKAKVDGVNGFNRQQVLINTKNSDCLKITYSHKDTYSMMGYIAPGINLEENKYLKLYIDDNSTNSLYVVDFNDLDEFENPIATMILEVPNTLGKQDFYYIWFEEETQEVVVQGKDGKTQRLSSLNSEGLKFDKFDGVHKVISNRTFESYSKFYTYQRIGNLNKSLNSKTVTLLGENEDFDVVLGSR